MLILVLWMILLLLMLLRNVRRKWTCRFVLVCNRLVITMISILWVLVLVVADDLNRGIMLEVH